MRIRGLGALRWHDGLVITNGLHGLDRLYSAEPRDLTIVSMKQVVDIRCSAPSFLALSPSESFQVLVSLRHKVISERMYAASARKD